MYNYFFKIIDFIKLKGLHMKPLFIILILLYPLTGQTTTYHPADTNQNWQISLEEFNAYNTAWRNSSDWLTAPASIPDNYVVRAGYLYKKAQCYNETTGNPPMNWDSDQDCDRVVDTKDGCPNDTNKITQGKCGCGKLETDRDKDNTPDCIDKCPDDPNKIEPGDCGCGKSEVDCNTQFTKTIGMTFVYIEPGTFMIGSPSDEPGRYNDETQHQVTLTKGYFMQTTEVTQGQWKEIMGNNPSYFSSCGTNCPVESVLWYDVQDFIEKLNQKESNRTYRLPTEAEWEYAARAGTTTALYNGPIEILGNYNAPALDPIAWYGGNSCVSYSGGHNCSGWPETQYSCSNCGTHEVAKKQPNSWGLFDMYGNVWEWCSDWYGSYPSSSVTDPLGASIGSKRVLRGGAWGNRARNCRSARRGNFIPGDTSDHMGFRLLAYNENPSIRIRLMAFIFSERTP